MAVTKEFACRNERCEKHNQTQEIRVSMNQSVLTCPRCGSDTLERVFSAAAPVSFKGQWFKTSGEY